MKSFHFLRNVLIEYDKKKYKIDVINTIHERQFRDGPPPDEISRKGEQV